MMEPEPSGQTGMVAEKPTQVSILLVDDEPANLLALEAVLGKLGQNLIKARSGKEALRHLIQEEFALIILDVSMPDMDGFETARLIRERDKNRLTPIIFLTAVGKSEHEIFKGYKAGAVDYILKPFVPEILRSKAAIFIELYEKTNQVRLLNEELKLHARDLEGANQDLKREVAVRQRAEQELRVSEEKLRELNVALEQRVAERTNALEEKARELGRSNAELQQFVHVASHDLKEPLRTINSFVQLLQMKLKGALDPEAEEYIKYVVEGAHRIQQLIGDLLSYTRLGAQSYSPQKVDLEKVLDNALSNLNIAIVESRAEIHRDPLPQLVADPTYMLLLFQNLIGNALKFRDKKPPRIRITARQKDDHWSFSVEDNGIGIDPQYFSKIFTVFQRLHSRDQYPGTGIGLALCKKVVEQQGGRIWVESQVGVGSNFSFTIPIKE